VVLRSVRFRGELYGRKEILRSNEERERHKPGLRKPPATWRGFEGSHSWRNRHQPARAWHQACPRLQRLDRNGDPAGVRAVVAEGERPDQEGQRQEATSGPPVIGNERI
jgi:hypothetical protein